MFFLSLYNLHTRNKKSYLIFIDFQRLKYWLGLQLHKKYLICHFGVDMFQNQMKILLIDSQWFSSHSSIHSVYFTIYFRTEPARVQPSFLLRICNDLEEDARRHRRLHRRRLFARPSFQRSTSWTTVTTSTKIPILTTVSTLMTTMNTKTSQLCKLKAAQVKK